jgi:hypothetical protein
MDDVRLYNVELLEGEVAAIYAEAAPASYHGWASSHFSALPGGVDDPQAQFDAIRQPGSVANGIFFLFGADPSSDLEAIRIRLPKMDASGLSFDYPLDMPGGYSIHLEETDTLDIEGAWPTSHQADGSGQWPAPFTTTDNSDGTATIYLPMGDRSSSFFRLIYSTD